MNNYELFVRIEKRWEAYHKLGAWFEGKQICFQDPGLVRTDDSPSDYKKLRNFGSNYLEECSPFKTCCCTA